MKLKVKGVELRQTQMLKLQADVLPVFVVLEEKEKKNPT